MERINKNKLMATEDIKKLLIKFSVPAIIGMLVNALYNVIDKIFLGQVSSLAIGGVHLTFPISLIIMAFSMLIGMGGNSLSSIRMGQGRIKESEKILGQSFTLFIIFSIVITGGLLLYTEELLIKLGSSKVLLPYAIDYLKILALGIPFQLIGFGLNFFIRGEGSPSTAMGTMLIGAITNIILDYIFVILMGMGVKGAALATIIGQFLSMIWVLVFFLGKRTTINLKSENLKLEPELVKEIIVLGLAPFGMQLAASLVITIFNLQIKTFGNDEAIAAMGIMQSISTLAFMPVFGLNQGSQPIIGYNFGAKKYHRVKEAFKLATIAATAYLTFTYLIIMFFPEALIKLFIMNAKDIDKVMPGAVACLRLSSLANPVLGFQIISANYFQATGKATRGIILSLSRQLIVLLPVLIIAPKFLGLNGVWLSYPISDVISFVLTGVFMVKELRLLNEGIELENSPS
ncbi:MATE family efflux transporter [Lagierella sp.]|uniref:MATE family efflux transporter n=1 Tax=Lagierella sp. TaxID=2849657 RepID=UPI00262F425C|nr:MATE family efflux transporter [Lagierella sp.]